MRYKLAISTERALGALRARIGQGARVAPAALEHASSIPAAAQTPANLRNLVLNAGDDVRAAKRMDLFAQHPIPAARRGAAEQVSLLEGTHPEQMFDLHKGYGEHLEVPFASQQKKDMLFGTGSSLHDPQGIMSTIPAAKPPTGLSDTLVDPQGLGALRTTQVTPQPPAATRVARRPKLGSDGTWTQPAPIQSGTSYQGRTQQIPQNPRAQISAAFDQQQHQLETQTPPEPKYAAAHKLHARIKFRDLPISIETPKGGYRHWTDAATGEEGKTKMQYPYGYIRRTKGLDGDHVDVFVGPNEQASHVYVVMTNKAPDFHEQDEEKCMLGFDSEEEAEAAFRAHYNKDGFFRSIKSLPYNTFKERVLDTFDGKRWKVALDTQTGVEERGLGYPPVGPQRHILGEPTDPSDRVERQFAYHDIDQHTTAIDGAWGAPEGGPIL